MNRQCKTCLWWRGEPRSRRVPAPCAYPPLVLQPQPLSQPSVTVLRRHETLALDGAGCPCWAEKK